MSRRDRSEIFRAFMTAMNAEKRGRLERAECYANELVDLLEAQGLIAPRVTLYPQFVSRLSVIRSYAFELALVGSIAATCALGGLFMVVR
jgi:hypothetical protein